METSANAKHMIYIYINKKGRRTRRKKRKMHIN
jgi:hypothetical protein